MDAAPSVLFDRENELRALESLARDAAGGSGGVAVVDGPAGIGKTALLRAIVRAAPALGLQALEARAAEQERGFPFGVVRQLLEPPVLAASAEHRVALL